MSDEPTGPSRRMMPRRPTKGVARVLRETDHMRLGIIARAYDISVGGIGIIISEELDLKEQVKIELRNDIQRFTKTVRGIVRHKRPRKDGGFVVGIEFYLRLTPLEVSLMQTRYPIDPDEPEEQGPIWM